MVKLREQLEQIFDEQDKLHNNFEKVKLEYIKNSNLISLRREKLIIEEINKFIELCYTKDENAKYDYFKFKTEFENYISYSISDLIEILKDAGYIGHDVGVKSNLWGVPYIKGITSLAY